MPETRPPPGDAASSRDTAERETLLTAPAQTRFAARADAARDASRLPPPPAAACARLQTLLVKACRVCPRARSGAGHTGPCSAFTASWPEDKKGGGTCVLVDKEPAEEAELRGGRPETSGRVSGA